MSFTSVQRRARLSRQNCDLAGLRVPAGQEWTPQALRTQVRTGAERRES